MSSSYQLLFFLSVICNIQCANILGVFMFPSFSHQINYQPFWRELSLRGHQVTVVTPNPLNDPTLTNLSEIDIGFTYRIVDEYKSKLFNADIVRNWDTIFKFMDAVAEAELNFRPVQALIADETKKFDVVVVECFHPVMYALGGRFRAPIIAITPMEVIAVDHQRFGNPSHPVLNPDTILGFDPAHMTLGQRVASVLFNLLGRIYYKYVLLGRSQVMADVHFGHEIPRLEEIERRVSLLLLNRNSLILPPRATVPSVVEIGLMHIQPTKPLPRDLQVFLDEAVDGVVYFSLGSSIQSTFLTPDVFKTILEVFHDLPFKVLWKCDVTIEGKNNIMTRKWLPQQDVLAHPNVKAFLTQGGPQSVEEAIAHDVPMIGMPFMADQPLNVKKIVQLGIGVSVSRNNLTKEVLKASIVEVATNPKYKAKIKKVHQLLFDKPRSALDNAIWWTEYVIRHKGAKHLRSSSADLSWFDYLMLDLVFVTISATYSLYFLVKKRFFVFHLGGSLRVQNAERSSIEGPEF